MPEASAKRISVSKLMKLITSKSIMCTDVRSGGACSAVCVGLLSTAEVNKPPCARKERRQKMEEQREERQMRMQARRADAAHAQRKAAHTHTVNGTDADSKGTGSRGCG